MRTGHGMACSFLLSPEQVSMATRPESPERYRVLRRRAAGRISQYLGRPANSGRRAELSKQEQVC
ncbi:hypothetical protein MGYG_08384 [Nannizzia gypsea CBS 118893]|uniref:Uncharacterized protein n=1 Tax=Arthroderma gypseum (strain ATCC MYA-4604 / CBS 118893) TaxID=535722 RepID=E4V5J8_ARTGP|nr:hypothetical protein MGYG_08384 [Nannizzia gypsea CBS 118893]EFR05373.1 hypothetical protein MGYG_08384 [Nannizzia gypsea CBS 118893]